MLGCGKEDNPTSGGDSGCGFIYGTVTDFDTGEFVSNASVRLNPIGETTITGSDGMFQFTDVPDGMYSLSLSKNGYVDLDDDYVIEIKNGKSVHRDVQLVIGFESFRITSNGMEIDSIDLGIFHLYGHAEILVTNNGTIPLDLKFSSSSGWIRFYSETSNYYIHQENVYGIYPNQGISMSILLDLSYYNQPSFIGSVYINSETLSKTIVIKGISE
jgi:hypothetical protein